MSPEDRRLAAILAAFVPERATALAALVGGAAGDELHRAVEALVARGRSARLAELARAVAPPAPAPLAAASRPGAGHPGSADRLRARLRLECAWARSGLRP